MQIGIMPMHPHSLTVDLLMRQQLMLNSLLTTLLIILFVLFPPDYQLMSMTIMDVLHLKPNHCVSFLQLFMYDWYVAISANKNIEHDVRGDDNGDGNNANRLMFSKVWVKDKGACTKVAFAIKNSDISETKQSRASVIFVIVL